MHPLFLLVLLGLVTYFIVRRVSGATRTAPWLLWLVAMTPAFIWSGWAWMNGRTKQVPSHIVLIPFVLCLVLYWLLVQWGRVSPPVNSATSPPIEPIPDDLSDMPTDLLPLSPLDKSEESSLHSCFPWSIYYLQAIEHLPQAVICRGQLRSQPDVAYQTIQDNIKNRFGDRFVVIFQEGADGKPFFALVTNPRLSDRGQTQPIRPSHLLIAGVLLVASFFTTCFAWLEMSGQLDVMGQPLPSTDMLWQGIPYAVSLLLILGGHEGAHYAVARRYQIRTTLPYFIPVLPLKLFPFGTFGAFIQLRSPVPHRRALFDLGVSGPLVGFALALPLLIWGLAHSDVVGLPRDPQLFNLQALSPKFSLLLALLAKATLGSSLTAGMALQLHPIAVAGWLGMVVTAINLMPLGPLDGGHIVHAMVGQRVGTLIGQVSRLLLLLLALVQRHLLLWAIILFLLPANDEPTLNDVAELDNRRDALGILALVIFLLIVLPPPKVLLMALGLSS